MAGEVRDVAVYRQYRLSGNKIFRPTHERGQIAGDDAKADFFNSDGGKRGIVASV